MHTYLYLEWLATLGDNVLTYSCKLFFYSLYSYIDILATKCLTYFEVGVIL